MRKNLFFLFTFWSVITVFSQKADELNQQSKELLQKNQYDKAMPILNPNSAIEKKEYFSILISNCVAVEKNKR